MTNTAKIYTTDFTLNDSATMNFVGGDTGFGYINASSSANFNGVTNFQLIGAIAKNDNMSYLFLESKDVSGNIKEGSVTVYDNYGNPLSDSGYTSNIVKVGDKYFLVFGEANNEGNENYPNANAQPPGGHLAGYENGIQPDGDTEGGDNQGGNEGGSDDKPITPSPSTPPTYDNPKDAIHSALKDAFIISDNYVGKAVNDIEKQFALMQDERKTYQGNLIYHNMLGRIAHLSSRNNNIAFNRNTNNYALSKSNSRIETEGMYLDRFNYSLGLYSRVYMPYSLELDVLGYYANNHNKYDRIFAGLSLHQGDYKRHNIGAQARLGYRFEFKNEHSLKPYLGILGSYYHMPSYKENGILPISRSTNTFTSLYGVL
ncbi:autotransporter outer membrane beta-barrel domain-containing protein [Campylobacter avium]|uniref:autotransporter outer membrane beta-barrel domain-containing protein n=1 Tax=Campylobacter avium TaxID=522485 RepID=UPI000B9A59E5|nr:autotransporter outer membrane beta-barrel domain-containing protein [Campylobacter avium]